MTENPGFKDRLARAALRPGSILFLLVILTVFCLTQFRIRRWERGLPAGEITFSAVIKDPGTPVPGDTGGSRAQTLVLADGTPVLLWMDRPGRKGDRVEGRARFEIPEGTRNPGGFSRRNWLWTKGAVWTGNASRVQVLEEEGLTLGIRRFPQLIRDKVRSDHSPFWLKGGGPFLLSLSVGDTRLLSDRQKYMLRTAGLSHLTSVSGTHLLFILTPFLRLTGRLRLPRRLRQAFLIPLLLLPGVLSGWKSGISRASTVSLLSQLDLPMRRRGDPFNSLCLAGSLILALRPYSLYDTAFWMSLSTAAAVRFTAGRIPGQERDLRGRLAGYLRRSLLFSLAAQAVILPYQILSAPGLHLLAPIANILALPLAAFLTAGTYLALAILSLFPAASCGARLTASLFSSCLSPGVRLFEWLAESTARSRAAFLPLKWFLLLLPLILGIILFMRGQGGRIRLHQKGAALVTLLWTLLVLALFFWPAGHQVLFLDVGQGDATLFISRGGRALLLDGGDRGQGYHTVIPAARSYAVTRIHLALVTHAHSDHAAGVAEMLEAGLIDRLCLPAEGDTGKQGPGDGKEDMTEELLRLAREAQVPVDRIQAGDRIEFAGFRIEVLHPQAGYRTGDLNEASLVTRVTLDQISLLMTGDLTDAGEASLLRTDRPLASDLLHVGHHGSRYSTTEAFLEAVDPGLALISVAEGNRYGHPHQELIDRLRERSIEVLRTDRSGAILLKIRGGKGRIKRWLD